MTKIGKSEALIRKKSSTVSEQYFSRRKVSYENSRKVSSQNWLNSRNMNWKNMSRGSSIRTMSVNSGYEKFSQDIENHKPLTRTTLRPFLLITLSHCERRNVAQSDVIARLRKLYSCRSIVVCVEPHKRGGSHYHIGLETRNASKNTYRKILQAAFPEFEGMQMHVRARKGFGPICAYITKVDKLPLIWGEFSLQEILKKASDSKKRKRSFIKQNQTQIKTVNKMKSLLLKIKWILLFQLVHYSLSLDIPNLFLFFFEEFDFLVRFLKEFWDGPGAETTPGLPESESTEKAASITILLLICFGCTAFVIIQSLFNNNE